MRYERLKHLKEIITYDSNPFITIYTTTYNRANILISRAIKSVLAQTYKNFEYIIVDDGSTDNTKNIVLSIKDPRIRLYTTIKRVNRHPDNSKNAWFVGSVIPSNEALKLAKGKYIARIDDDDTWTEDHLEKLLRFAQDNDYEFVTSLYEEEREGKKSVVNGTWLESPYYYPKRKSIDIDSPKTGAHSGFLFKSYLKFAKYNKDCWRKSWNKVSDCDLYARMYQAGVKMGFLEEVLTFVYPRPNETKIGLDAYVELEKKGIKNDK